MTLILKLLGLRSWCCGAQIYDWSSNRCTARSATSAYDEPRKANLSRGVVDGEGHFYVANSKSGNEPAKALRKYYRENF
jgi:hypothetical protein